MSDELVDEGIPCSHSQHNLSIIEESKSNTRKHRVNGGRATQ